MGKYTLQTEKDMEEVELKAMQTVLRYGEEFMEWMMEHVDEIHAIYLREQEARMHKELGETNYPHRWKL